MAEQRTLKRIGVVVHQDRPLAAELAARVIAWSEALGATVMLTDADARAAGAPSLAVESEQLVTADVVVAIGGDGTVLRAVGMVADAGVPLVALNAGQLGYLADVAPERAEWALDELAAGRGRLEERMRVQATVTPAAGDPQTPISTRTGLNEVVVERSLTGHTLRLRVYLDGEFFTSYVTDGMVVATPTGSTAYAFSARGPIVDPLHRSLQLTPVSPHMLFDRTLVLAPDSQIRLEVQGHRRTALSVDGRSIGLLGEGDAVVCTASPRIARLVTFGPRSFHQVLKVKFGLNDR